MIEKIEEAVSKLPEMLTEKQFEEFEEAINRIAKEAQEKIEQERLRDTFAGLAMQGLLSNNLSNEFKPSEITKKAYVISDAMLTARSEKNEI